MATNFQIAKYVDAVGGNDGNSGNTPGAAYATLQTAVNNIASGQLIGLTTNTVESATIDLTAVGGSGNPAGVIAVDASGNPFTDDTRRTIDMSGLSAGSVGIRTSTGNNAWQFIGINIVGAAGLSHGFQERTTGCQTTMIRCRVTAFGGAAFEIDSSRGARFAACELDNCDGGGIIASTNTGILSVAGCRIHNNGSHGVEITRSSFGFINDIAASLIYGNSGDGLVVPNRANIKDCTIHGNDGDGIEIQNSNGPFNVLNTSVSGNGGYAVRTGGTGTNLFDFSHCHAHDNTLGDIDDGVLPGIGIVDGDPLFADAMNGDFQPGAGSPLIGAGVHGGDIGAIQSAGGGGGGAAFRPSNRTLGGF